jgi:2-haloacid dehalogenase
MYIDTGIFMKAGIKKYHGFLIDADNTLFNFPRAEREAFFTTLENIPYTEHFETVYRKFAHINKNLWKVVEQKKISIEALKIERFSILLRLLNIQADAKKLSDSFLTELSKKSYMLPHTVEVLSFLSKKSFICLISNGVSMVQRGRIARAGIEIFFHDIIISEEIGVIKPDPEFFSIATRNLHLPHYDILCVGDSPSADIEGGSNAGFDTCWYINAPLLYPQDKQQPDYIISDLRELKKFVHDVS